MWASNIRCGNLALLAGVLRTNYYRNRRPMKKFLSSILLTVATYTTVTAQHISFVGVPLGQNIATFKQGMY